MNDDTPPRQSSLRLPSNARDFWALILSVLAVFLLVQIGAPLIRELEFLDPKLREYFIGISFAAFPLIHRTCKQNLVRLSASTEPVRHDSTPWYVAGVVAAAVLFGWNQFVSLLSGMSMGVLFAAFEGAGIDKIDPDTVNSAATTAAIVIVLPLSAIAALFAGILLNRYTRSHTFLAVALASICFITINTMMTWAFQPQMIDAIVAMIAQGGEQAAQVLFGVALVGIVIFVFASAGVLISRYNRERPVGRIIEAAKRFPPQEREALALELAQRADINAHTRVQPASAAV
jgi:hypothetical protein